MLIARLPKVSVEKWGGEGGVVVLLIFAGHIQAKIPAFVIHTLFPKLLKVNVKNKKLNRPEFFYRA